MKKNHYAYLFAAIMILICCENENNNPLPVIGLDQALIGSWKDSEAANPKGLYVYQIIINNNARVVMKSTSYGIYENQSTNDISSWHEVYGKIEQRYDSLFMNSEKHIWWDSFYIMEPETEYIDEYLQSFWCTYTIKKDTLITISYTSPADYPILTYKRYIKE